MVIGPAAGAPARLAAVSRAGAPLARRLPAFRRAALRAGRGAELIDAHFALYAAGPLLLSRLRGTPAVVHFHGPWADESSVERGEEVHGLRRVLEAAVLRHARAYVVLSSAFRRVLVERYGVVPWDVHVLPPGVDLERFSPGDRAAARDRLGIPAETRSWPLSVRRLVPRTGVGELLDAWELAAAELPAGATLLVAGDGPLAGELGARASAIASRAGADGGAVERRGPAGRLPRRRRGGRADAQPRGLRPRGARGGGMRDAEHRHRRRRPPRGRPPPRPDPRGAGRRPAGDGDAARRGGARRAAGTRGGARVRRALLVAGGGGRAPAALPPRPRARARGAPAGRLPRPRRAALGRGDRAAAAAAPSRGRRRPRHPRRGRAARDAPAAGRDLGRGAAAGALRARPAPRLGPRRRRAAGHGAGDGRATRCASRAGCAASNPTSSTRTP